MIKNINIADDTELGFDPDCDCYRCERLRMDAIWDDADDEWDDDEADDEDHYWESEGDVIMAQWD